MKTFILSALLLFGIAGFAVAANNKKEIPAKRHYHHTHRTYHHHQVRHHPSHPHPHWHHPHPRPHHPHHPYHRYS